MRVRHSRASVFVAFSLAFAAMNLVEALRFAVRARPLVGGGEAFSYRGSRLQRNGFLVRGERVGRHVVLEVHPRGGEPLRARLTATRISASTLHRERRVPSWK